MTSFNKVLLLGNLTRDPETRELGGNLAVCKFGLAVNRKVKTRSGESREDVLFVDCTAFEKKAELIQRLCRKGSAILIDGQLRLDTWDDKATGQKRSKLYVVIDNFSLLGGKRQDEDEAFGIDPNDIPF